MRILLLTALALGLFGALAVGAAPATAQEADATQVNQLLKQFFEARKIAKTLSSGKMLCSGRGGERQRR